MILTEKHDIIFSDVIFLALTRGIMEFLSVTSVIDKYKLKDNLFHETDNGANFLGTFRNWMPRLITAEEFDEVHGEAVVEDMNANENQAVTPEKKIIL